MKRHERISRGVFSTITAQVDDRPACEGCDTDYWFSTSPVDRRLALRICNGDPDTGRPACPVRQACLDKALTIEARGQVDTRHVRGIFGGLTAPQRVDLIVPVCPRCDAPRARNRHYCEPCVEVARAEAKLRSDAKKRMRRAAA